MEIRFKLNSKKEKDKVIIELLSREYDRNEFLKSLLYKVAIEGYIGKNREEEVKYTEIISSNEGRLGKVREDIIENEFSEFF